MAQKSRGFLYAEPGGLATETRRDLFLLLMLVLDVNLCLYLPITSTSMSTNTKGDCETLKKISAKPAGADRFGRG